MLQKQATKNLRLEAKDTEAGRTVCVEALSPGSLLHVSLSFTSKTIKSKKTYYRCQRWLHSMKLEYRNVAS